MAKEIISPENRFAPEGYSHAIKAGKTIYLAGQVAFDKDGNVVGKGDMKAQTEQLLKNMKDLLEAAGATMADVVKLNMYVTNIDELENIMEPYLKYFQPPLPAATGVEVSRLSGDVLIEVDGIAVID